MSGDAEIKRGFVDVAHGQMHYRSAGTGTPLLLLHASPGSSRQQVGLIADLADGATVFAPDTPGNGDSVALSADEPQVADLAQAMLAFLDAAELDRVNLYGSHTGAAIASELAILAPDRIDRVVLDGVSMITGAELEDILTHYAHPFPPDREGAYLARVFQFCRDQYLFFPWYRRTRDARRDNGLGSAEDVHAWVVEVLKACETYHLNYRAAFKWPAADRLPLVTRPTLTIAGENDPLFQSSVDVAPLVPDGQFLALPRFDAPDFRQRRAAAIKAFFADSER